MANYRLSIDLMAQIGAQIIYLKARPRKEGETDEDYAKVPVLEYAAVPTQFNDIRVSDDTSDAQYRNFSGKHAYMSIRDQQIDLNSKLLKAQRTRLLQNGEQETPYNVVCRDVKPSYSQKFTDDMRRRYAAQLKATNPDLANLEDQGASLPRGTERNALTRAINAKFPFSIGNGYLIEQRTPSAGQNTPVPGASAPGPTEQYTAPTTPIDPFSAAANGEDEYSDVPF